MSNKFIVLSAKDIYESRKRIHHKYEIGISHYQRKDKYDDNFVNDLHDSILKDYPIGQILLHKLNKKNKYAIIDGRQRSSSIIEIIDFPLQLKINSTMIKKLTERSRIIEELNLDEKKQKTIIDSMIKKSRKIKNVIKNMSAIELVDFNYEKTIKNNIPIIGGKLERKFTKYLMKIFDELIDNQNKILKYEISIHISNNSYNEIINIFKRINTSGIHINNCEIIAALWSNKEFVSSYIPEIEEIIMREIDYIIREDTHFIDYDIINKKKVSVYFYLMSFEKYLSNRFKLWNIISKKSDDSKFKLICDVIIKYHNLDSHDEIPNFIIEQYQSKNKMKKFENNLINFIRIFNKKLYNFTKFCSKGKNKSISQIHLFNCISDYNKNGEIFNDICFEILFDDNKLKDIDIDDLDINKFYKVISKIIDDEITNNKKEISLFTKKLFYIYCKSIDNNSNINGFDYIIEQNEIQHNNILNMKPIIDISVDEDIYFDKINYDKNIEIENKKKLIVKTIYNHYKDFFNDSIPIFNIKIINKNYLVSKTKIKED
jgi:hypothetical protein